METYATGLFDLRVLGKGNLSTALRVAFYSLRGAIRGGTTQDYSFAMKHIGKYHQMVATPRSE